MCLQDDGEEIQVKVLNVLPITSYMTHSAFSIFCSHVVSNGWEKVLIPENTVSDKYEVVKWQTSKHQVRNIK